MANNSALFFAIRISSFRLVQTRVSVVSNFSVLQYRDIYISICKSKQKPHYLMQRLPKQMMLDGMDTNSHKILCSLLLLEGIFADDRFSGSSRNVHG